MSNQAAGLVGDSINWPPLDSGRHRFSGNRFREVDITGPADQGGDQPAPFFTEYRFHH